MLITMLISLAILALILFFEFFRISQLLKRERRRDMMIKNIQADMRALCSGAVVVDDHIVNLNKKLQHISERQSRLDLNDGRTRNYEHAVRLAQKGCSLEELMEACGLVRGEAELLLHMHQPANESLELRT